MSEFITIVIVDDEPPARRGIRKELIRFPSAKVIGEASTGDEAVELIQNQKPDLVFLDIQMPLLNGLEVIDEIGPDTFPNVIFVTAYDRYAIEAFKVHAVDYILKPIDLDRFEKAYHRAVERIRYGKREMEQDGVQSLIRIFQEKLGARSNRLVIQEAGKVFFLDYIEIVWIEASGNYLNIHTKEKQQPILIRETMQGMEERLKSKSFLRVHRSKMVNLDNVKLMEQQGDGRFKLFLNNDKKLLSSRRYKVRIEQALADWF